jgi:hypothetical protein
MINAIRVAMLMHGRLENQIAAAKSRGYIDLSVEMTYIWK